MRSGAFCMVLCMPQVCRPRPGRARGGIAPFLLRLRSLPDETQPSELPHGVPRILCDEAGVDLVAPSEIRHDVLKRRRTVAAAPDRRRTHVEEDQQAALVDGEVVVHRHGGYVVPAAWPRRRFGPLTPHGVLPL